MIKLRLSAPWKVVKVGGTAADIQEGIKAGVWSVGVVVGSSQMGLSNEKLEGLSEAEKLQARDTVVALDHGTLVQNNEIIS